MPLCSETVTGNHLRLVPHLAENAGLAVLHEGAHGLGGVHDFESVQRRRQRGDDVGLGHRHVDLAKLHERMPAGEQVLGIDVGDRAGRRDIHVSAHQNRAHGRSGLDGLGLLLAARRASAHHRRDSGGDELVGIALERRVRKAVEHEGSFDRLEIVSIIRAVRERCLCRGWRSESFRPEWCRLSVPEFQSGGCRAH